MVAVIFLFGSVAQARPRRPATNSDHTQVFYLASTLTVEKDWVLVISGENTQVPWRLRLYKAHSASDTRRDQHGAAAH